jgi:hypothetical protein
MAVVVTYSGLGLGIKDDNRPLTLGEFCKANINSQKQTLLDNHPTHARNRVITYSHIQKKYSPPAKNIFQMFSFRTGATDAIESYLNEFKDEEGHSHLALGNVDGALGMIVTDKAKYGPDADRKTIEFVKDIIVRQMEPDYFMKIEESQFQHPADGQSIECMIFIGVSYQDRLQSLLNRLYDYYYYLVTSLATASIV